MKHSSKLALFVVTLLLMSSFIPALSYASSVDTLQNQARDARARIGEMEQSLEQSLSAHSKASEELRETEAEIGRAEDIARELEESIEQNRDTLAEQAEFMYRSRGRGYLELIFAAQNVAEFARSLELVNFLATADANTIESLQRQTRQHAQVLGDLSDLRVQQEKTEIARRADVASAQALLNEQEAYVRSLDAQVRDALERQQEEARRQAAASSPAPPSGSNQTASASGSSGGSSSASSGGGSYTETGVTFTGVASWYETGTTTANGERFNPDALTAAHKTLPFNTLVRVTFRGQSVVVRINDRGPFTGGRIIDLSRGAAAQIGLKSAGVGTVTVEVVQREP